MDAKEAKPILDVVENVLFDIEACRRGTVPTGNTLAMIQSKLKALAERLRAVPALGKAGR